MKAKDYLKQVELLDEKIDQRNKQIDDLRQMAVSGKGIDYSKDKIQTSVSGDAISEIVIKYIELENDLIALENYIQKYIQFNSTSGWSLFK